MAKRKNTWDSISKAEQQKMAKTATQKMKTPPATGEGKRKMVRIGLEEHAKLKKAAAWLEMGMQEYLEELINKSFDALFPGKK